MEKKLKTDIYKDQIIKKNHFKNFTCAVIVARTKSKRLKNKSLLKIGNSNLLDHLIKRVKRIDIYDKIIFCTTKDKSDDKLIEIAKKNRISFYRGPELDVLSRIMEPLKKIKPDNVIRITGDDILIDKFYAEIALNYFEDNNLDYVDHKKLIGGTETEIFSYDILKFIQKNFKDLNGTEYLTNYITENKGFFNIGSAPVHKKDQLNISMTIDTKKEYLFVKKFLNFYYKKNSNF